MQIAESMKMAVDSLRSNKLRTGLTLLSMSIGVFAIVGVAAFVGAINSTLDDQLEAMGRNSYYIQREPAMEFGDHMRRYRNRQPISLRQGLEFKRRMTGVKEIGLTNFMAGGVIRYADMKTDPDVFIYGADEAFLSNFDYSIDQGRGIDPQDVQLASDVVVIGSQVADELFKHVSAVGQSIKINEHRYLVIGVYASKGAIFGQSQDNFVMVPITSSAKYFFDEWSTSVAITVSVGSAEDVDGSIDQATGLMRIIRGVGIGEDNDFEIQSNESIADAFGSFTGYLSLFGAFCGAIALFAAGIGIMNIMLVSVKERTREIGIRKAIGATRRAILSQFMIEAVTLCQLGALIGASLGVLGGLAISLAMGTSATVPWFWVFLSMAICFGIGLVFGSYPAWRAARLDPIEALRYE
jgi:putative ABC transport system permease protein